MGRLHDSNRNSYRGAVAPFLDHRPHVVIFSCIYVVATFCHVVGPVSTMSIQHFRLPRAKANAEPAVVHNNLVGFTPQPFRLEFMMQSSEDQKIVHSRNSGQTPSGYGSLNSETIVNG